MSFRWLKSLNISNVINGVIMRRQFVKKMFNPVLNKFLKMKVIDSYQQADFFSTDLFKALNVTVDVIFDVGANVGQCTTSFRQNFPEAQIHSFEPVEDTFNKLSENCSKIDVELNKLAASDRAGHSEISVDSRNSLVSSLEIKHAGSESVTIETIRLDDYIKDHSIKHIGIVKVDVEGHEAAVISGLAVSLTSLIVDAVVIEATFTPEVIKSMDFFELVPLMKKYGYRLQGLYELDYSHIYTKGVFKLGNALFLKESNPYFK